MTREELKPALEWADSCRDKKVMFPARREDFPHLMHAPALASALREAWAEIDRLKAHLSNPLDAALNEGDGTYKP